MASDKVCRECGLALTPEQRRKGAAFCCPAHRVKWHNRRKERGAELYDLVMAWRFDRAAATQADVLGMMSRLASAYNDADKALRDGRRSYALAEAIERLPLAYGAHGDKR